jgi:hypothetical protein
LDFDELSLLTFFRSDVTVVLLTSKVLAIIRMPEPLLAMRMMASSDLWSATSMGMGLERKGTHVAHCIIA